MRNYPHCWTPIQIFIVCLFLGVWKKWNKLNLQIKSFKSFRNEKCKVRIEKKFNEIVNDRRMYTCFARLSSNSFFLFLFSSLSILELERSAVFGLLILATHENWVSSRNFTPFLPLRMKIRNWIWSKKFARLPHDFAPNCLEMENTYSEVFVYSDEVALARKEGKAIVALESTIIVLIFKTFFINLNENFTLSISFQFIFLYRFSFAKSYFFLMIWWII